MRTRTVPIAPAVEIETGPVVTEADMALVVPDWALRFAREDEGSPWIRMPKFQAGRYLPISRDAIYDRANRYNVRVWKQLQAATGGLVDMAVYEPRFNELACSVHDPEVKGETILISKRRFLVQILGYLPRIWGWQP